MKSLQIKSGKISISIVDGNDKEKGILEFNPSEISFAERYQRLTINFQERSKVIVDLKDTLDKAIKASDDDSDADREVAGKVFTAIKELYDFVDDELNALFGEGTSAMLFSAEKDTDEYLQFFKGLSPYMQTARAEKVKDYAPPKKSKKAPRTVKGK